MKLTAFQHKTLYALCSFGSCVSAVVIARRMRKPRHKLAVTSALRSVFNQSLGPDFYGAPRSTLLCQLSAATQWDSKPWAASDKLFELLGYRKTETQDRGTIWEIDACPLP